MALPPGMGTCHTPFSLLRTNFAYLSSNLVLNFTLNGYPKNFSCEQTDISLYTYSSTLVSAVKIQNLEMKKVLKLKNLNYAIR